MAPLVIRKPNGDQIPLNALTPLRGISTGEQKQDLLNADTVSLEVRSTEPLDISIGDTLPVFGQLYTINQLPKYTKSGEHVYLYDITLEGPQYHLLRVLFLDQDATGVAMGSGFSLTGNLAFMVQVLFTNMVRVFSGAWGLGTVLVPGESTNDGLPGTPVSGATTITKTLTFDNENCLGVLQRLCAVWGTEFWIEYRPNDAPNRILNIGPAGHTLSDTFKYGQGNGLYTLTRQSVSQSNFYTRAFIYGGNKNLPTGYKNYAQRLLLPDVTTAQDSFVQNTDAIATYGLIEGGKVFEEIYPGRTGTVVEVVDALSFTDPSVDFNPFQYSSTKTVNGNVRPVYDYIIDGVAPKVSFLTGDLAGYNFDLIKFFENNFILQIKSVKDDNGLEFPSPDPASPFRIKPGDTYVFIDMIMPPEYVAVAEAKLLDAGRAWLSENGSPSVEYALELDEQYLQKKAGDTNPIPLDNPPNFFAVGDAIRIVDTRLNVDRLARITAFSRDMLRPYKYTLTLGDVRKISILQRVLSTQKKIQQVVAQSGLNNPTVPVQTPSPSQIPSKAEVLTAIATQTNPIAHGMQHTFFVKPLPEGFWDLLNKDLARHRFEMKVAQRTPDELLTMIGRVQATGKKFRL